MTLNKERVDRIVEIQHRLEILASDDRRILVEIQSDPAHPWVNHIGIAADLYILPRLVSVSLDKLLEMGFLTEVQLDETRKGLQLNQNGSDAQILTKVLYPEDVGFKSSTS